VDAQWTLMEGENNESHSEVDSKRVSDSEVDGEVSDRREVIRVESP
jgi:hypothetical protein